MSGTTELIARIDERFSTFEALLEKRFNVADGRFSILDDKLNVIEDKFEAIDKRFDTIDERFDAADRKFATKEELYGMELRLTAQFSRLIDDLGTKVLDIYDHIDGLANRVSTYHQEFLMPSGQVGRHERWHHEVAGRLGTKLKS